MTTREPGGSPGAEVIRKLVVEGAPGLWDDLTETLLFNAARADHLAKRVWPALQKGEVVLCDRFVDSTLVYQGVGKGLGVDYLRDLHLSLFGNFMPHLTFILDIPPKQGLERAKARAGAETRFENMKLTFHESVREGFLAIARQEPERCVVIDASQPVEKVHSDMREAISVRLGITL